MRDAKTTAGGDVTTALLLQFLFVAYELGQYIFSKVTHNNSSYFPVQGKVVIEQ